MAIKTRRDVLPFETGIKTELLFPCSQLLTSIIGVGVQPNKAIVGRNAFAHEAGIHQDGFLKERTTYEIIDPKTRRRAREPAGAGQAQRPARAEGALRRRWGCRWSASELDELYVQFLGAGRPQERDPRRARSSSWSGACAGKRASSKIARQNELSNFQLLLNRCKNRVTRRKVHEIIRRSSAHGASSGLSVFLGRLSRRSVWAACARSPRVAACGGGSGGADDRWRRALGVLAENALTANALTANALTANALTANALTANALTANALTANALTANGLQDPLGRELLKYVVSCALPDGRQRVDHGRRHALHVPGLAGPGARVGQRARLVRWQLPALGLGLRAGAGRRRRRRAEISIRGDDTALRPAPHELRDYPDARGDLLRQHVRRRAAALSSACRRARRRICASAGRRWPTAR